MEPGVVFSRPRRKRKEAGTTCGTKRFRFRKRGETSLPSRVLRIILRDAGMRPVRAARHPRACARSLGDLDRGGRIIGVGGCRELAATSGSGSRRCALASGISVTRTLQSVCSFFPPFSPHLHPPAVQCNRRSLTRRRRCDHSSYRAHRDSLSFHCDQFTQLWRTGIIFNSTVSRLDAGRQHRAPRRFGCVTLGTDPCKRRAALVAYFDRAHRSVRSPLFRSRPVLSPSCADKCNSVADR